MPDPTVILSRVVPMIVRIRLGGGGRADPIADSIFPPGFSSVSLEPPPHTMVCERRATAVATFPDRDNRPISHWLRARIGRGPIAALAEDNRQRYGRQRIDAWKISR
jgi:hypothetical protein